MSDELKHWGVKGMKWKDHDYVEEEKKKTQQKQSFANRLSNLAKGSAKVAAAVKKVTSAGASGVKKTAASAKTTASRVANSKAAGTAQRIASKAAAKTQKAAASAAAKTQKAAAKAKAKAQAATNKAASTAKTKAAKKAQEKYTVATKNSKASYQSNGKKIAAKASYQQGPGVKKENKMVRNAKAAVTKAVAKAKGEYTYKPHEQRMITRDNKQGGTKDPMGRKLVNLNSANANARYSPGGKAPSKAERKKQLKLAAADIKNTLRYGTKREGAVKETMKNGLNLLKGHAKATAAETKAAAKSKLNSVKSKIEANKRPTYNQKVTKIGKDGQVKVSTKKVKGAKVQQGSYQYGAGTAPKAKTTVGQAVASKAKSYASSAVAKGKTMASNAKSKPKSSGSSSLKSKAQSVVNRATGVTKATTNARASYQTGPSAQARTAEQERRNIQDYMIANEKSFVKRNLAKAIVKNQRKKSQFGHADSIENALWHQFGDKYDTYDILLHMYAGILYELDALCCSEGLTHADSNFSAEVEAELATLSDAQYEQVIEAIAEYEAREFGL